MDLSKPYDDPKITLVCQEDVNAAVWSTAQTREIQLVRKGASLVLLRVELRPSIGESVAFFEGSPEGLIVLTHWGPTPLAKVLKEEEPVPA